MTLLHDNTLLLSDPGVPAGYHLVRRTMSYSDGSDDVTHIVRRKDQTEVGRWSSKEDAIRAAVADHLLSVDEGEGKGDDTDDHTEDPSHSCDSEKGLTPSPEDEMCAKNFPCFWCEDGYVSRGVLLCPRCYGTKKLSVAAMFLNHDGKTHLAEVAAPMFKAGVKPVWWDALVGPERRDLEILIKNPCMECGSYHLDPHWLGTGFCSRACTVKFGKKDWAYSRSMLAERDGEDW